MEKDIEYEEFDISGNNRYPLIVFNKKKTSSRELVISYEDRIYKGYMIYRLINYINGIIYLPSICSEFKKVREDFERSIVSLYNNADISSFFKSISEMYNVKLAKDLINGNCNHEFFIYDVCINPLRRYVPNFTFMYFGTSWIQSHDHNNKLNRYSSEQPDKNISMLCIENIDGISLYDALPSLDFNILLSYIYQIFYALDRVNSEFDFSHNNLHDKCIHLMSMKEKSFDIPYQTQTGRTIYVRSDKVAVITDFSRAHVKYRGDHYGRERLEEMHIYSDRSRPMYDIYKIYMYIMRRLDTSKNKECFSKLSKSFHLFSGLTGMGVDDIKTYISNGLSEFFNIPITSSFNNYSIGDIIREFHKIYEDETKLIITSEQESNVLSLTTNTSSYFEGVKYEVKKKGNSRDYYSMLREYNNCDDMLYKLNDEELDEYVALDNKKNKLMEQLKHSKETIQSYFDKTLSSVIEDINRECNELNSVDKKSFGDDKKFLIYLLAKYLHVLFLISKSDNIKYEASEFNIQVETKIDIDEYKIDEDYFTYLTDTYSYFIKKTKHISNADITDLVNFSLPK